MIRNKRTNSEPVIIHAPAFTVAKVMGVSHRIFCPLWPVITHRQHQRFRKGKKIDTQRASGLTVITWNNSKQPGMFEQCLNHYSISYINVAENIETWDNIYKITKVIDILHDIDTPYVLGCDSFDVALLQSPKEALDRFKNMSCNMLFNGEMALYPNCGLNKDKGVPYITEELKNFQYSMGRGPFRYLNAGAWIGRTAFLEEFFNEALKVNIKQLVENKDLPERPSAEQLMVEDDQIILQILFKKYHPRIAIDYDNVIFLNIFGLDLKKMSETGIVLTDPGLWSNRKYLEFLIRECSNWLKGCYKKSGL